MEKGIPFYLLTLKVQRSGAELRENGVTK